jgi:phage antirepressor YoqD-like protein
VKKILSTDLVRVVYGDNGGTWMHEDVALEFARWLNPAFAIWCNDRIKELLKTGVTTVSNDDEAIAYAMQVLNKRLEQTRQEKAMLEQQNNYLTTEIKQSAPKVKYYDDCLQSVNTLTTTQVAKQIGLDAEKLHKKLKEIGVIYRQSGQWLLHSPYSTWGLHATRTQTYTRSDGSTGTSIYTVWTEKGRRFIIALYQEGFDLKKAIKLL